MASTSASSPPSAAANATSAIAPSLREVNARLASWAVSVIPQAAVHFGAPPIEPAESAVCFHLADLEPVKLARGLRAEPPLRITATYLVSAWTQNNDNADQLTEQLLFAAMDDPRFLAVSSGASLWRTLGLPSHPSFAVQIAVEKARAAPPPARAVENVQLSAAPSRVLHGAVRGPKKIPIPDALVEIPALNLQARTDERGMFTIGAVATAIGPVTVRLTAKGIQRDIRTRLPRFPAPLILDVSDLNP